MCLCTAKYSLKFFECINMALNLRIMGKTN